MAVIKKTLFSKNLTNYSVLVNDTDVNSKYFKVTSLPDTFTGGKNAFLIAGSEYLVPDTKIQIELRDASGNIMYHEPGEGLISSSVNGQSFIAEYYEGVSKVVSVYVYPDTAFGPCTLTILGELSSYESDGGITSIVPLDWENKYNVKWQRQINVDPSLANTTKIRFYQRPQATITEILNPIYTIVSGSKVASAVTQSFADIKLSKLETFAGDVKRIKVFRTSEGDISDYDLIQDILVESKELLTSYGLTGSVVGNTGTFTSETLKNYWNSGSLNAVLNSERIAAGIRLTGNGNFTYTSSLDIKSANTYELNLDAFYSSSTASNLEIYLKSGSASSSIGKLYGIAPTKNLSDTVIPFKTDKDYISASLYFSQSQGDWHLGNISLKLSQDTAFSPDEISFVTTMPTAINNQTYNFKFEFYDVNNNYVPVAVTQSATFTGGNAGATAKILTFQTDRSAFRFSTGSFGNPANQTVKFSTQKTNLTGSLTYASSAFDIGGNYITPASYAGTYPGTLTNVSDNGALLTIANFSGSVASVLVGSIVYTASCENFIEFETIYRFEDGDNAPGVFVTSNTNQFIYKATDLSQNPSGQTITIEAKRKNLASTTGSLTVNSGSGPALTLVSTNPTNGVDTYTLSGTSYPYSTGETIYSISGSDQFGNVFSDAIKISPVKILDGFSVAVSNENTSFPALSIGTVVGGFAASSGSITVKVGNEPINYSSTFVTNSFSASIDTFAGLTPNTFNGTNYSINALSADSGSLTLLVKYKDGGGTIISSSKEITYSKVKKAVPNILISATPQSQTVVANSTGTQTGTLADVTISALEGNTSRFTSMVITSTTGFSTLPTVTGTSNILVMTSAVMNAAEASVTLTVTHTDSESTSGQTQTITIRCTKVSVGQDGNNGSNGTNAKTVVITADNYVVTYDGNGSLSPGSQTVILTATSQNFTTPYYEFTKNGTIVRAYATTATYTIATLPSSGVSDLYQVNVKEGNVGSVIAFDNTDIFGVKAGTDSYTIFLTNEAHTLPAANDGTVSSYVGSGTSIIVYKGATELNGITSGTPTTGEFKVTSVVTTGTITIGAQTSTGNPVIIADHSAMTSDLATITYTINVENLVTITKLQSLSKSKKGDDGSPGNNGNDGKRTATGMIFYQPSAASAPSTPTATTYTFSTNTFASLTANWAVGAPTYTAGNTNKYWYSTYTAVETTAGGGTAVPTFSAPAQAINFTGLVTFTGGNEITDGTTTTNIVPSGSVTNHIGGPGVTTILGSRISTGVITSTGYTIPAGDTLAVGGYTNAGTIFNLDNGSLRSKNFYISSAGDAFFKGTLTIAGTDLTAANTLNTQANIEAGLGYTPTTAAAAATAANSAAKTGGSIGGVTIASTKIYVGTGTHGNANTGFYVDSDGKMSLKDKLVWDGDTLSITGNIVITAGATKTAIDTAAAVANSATASAAAATSAATTAQGTANAATASAAAATSAATTAQGTANAATASAAAASTLAGTKISSGSAAADVNSNSTNISGGKIRTGIIESTGYSYPGTGNFSTTGTQINLDNGLIRSKNFGITSAGDAYFKGAINGGTISIGSKFNVDSQGNVSATNAALTGSIVATSGQIGDWIIDAGKLTNSTGTISIDATGRSIIIYSGSIPKVSISGQTELTNPYANQINSGPHPTIGNVNTSFSETTTISTNIDVNKASTGWFGNIPINSGPQTIAYYGSNIDMSSNSMPIGHAAFVTALNEGRPGIPGYTSITTYIDFRNKSSNNIYSGQIQGGFYSGPYEEWDEIDPEHPYQIAATYANSSTGLRNFIVTFNETGNYEWRIRVDFEYRAAGDKQSDNSIQYLSTTCNASLANANDNINVEATTNLIELTNRGFQVLNNQDNFVQIKRYDGSGVWNDQPLINVQGGQGIRSYGVDPGGGNSYGKCLDLKGRIDLSDVNGGGFYGMFPSNDIYFSNGTSAKRWTSIYAQNGTIQTSDRN
jgi:hypothetical protein